MGFNSGFKGLSNIIFKCYQHIRGDAAFTRMGRASISLFS